MMERSQYDAEIADLERKLRRLRALRRSARPKSTGPKRKIPSRPFRQKAAAKRPPDVQAYWDMLRGMACVVTGRTDRLTLHHCHSGSMCERGVNRGVGQKVSDWLVIPLTADVHCIGPEAIDGAKGVLTWEAQNGRQADHIDALIARTGIDVWALAGVAPMERAA